MTELKLDIIGDVHGELPALKALGKKLGYDVENAWTHPENRVPVFLGDLVDRGAHSLEVVELVKRLVEEERGACLMGNHEYNLVAHWMQMSGYEKPKSSNRATIAQLEREPRRRDAALEFLRTLPMAFVVGELRIIHACWHTKSYEEVKQILAPSGGGSGGALRGYVALESPFAEKGLKEGLHPWNEEDGVDAPHELLLKGFEVPAEESFLDSERVTRTMKRATWWLDETKDVLRDGIQVFGHYWNLPPVEKHFAPPYPSGHPKLRAWRDQLFPRVPDEGVVPLEGNIACVDFNGVTEGSTDGKACVGALSWPERQIVWATAARTRKVEAHGQ